MSLDMLTTGHHGSDGLEVSKLLRNDPEKKWVVQKFGGTSVGKFADRVVEGVVKPGLEENRIAVVCSARSNNTKSEGTTNRLLKAASEAELAQPKNFIHIVNCIREEHIQSAARYIQSPSLLESFSAQVTAECEGLMRFLEAVQTVGETSPGILDRLVSKGENLSCRFVAALLEDRGVNAQFVDLSETIDFKSDHGLDQVFYNNVAVAFRGVIEACEDRVPVLTGYFGPVQGGLLKNIGRGYTDLCAALVAVGVRAEELQIWKEVDGIFTADPRKVPTARLLPTISPDEAAELTFYGSEVVHPFTMQQVIEASIPIRIKNVMNPRGDGTVIAPEPVKAKVLGEERKLFRNRSASLLSPHQRPKRPTAVTIKHKILVLNVHSNKRAFASGYFFAHVFSTLSKWGLATDLISTSQVNVSMVLHSGSALVSGVGEDEKKVIDRDLRGAIDELSQYGTVDLIDGMAILSLVGKQLKNNVGIAGKMFSALGDNNVNIEMISQGASEVNISCVIEERDADRAINILHTNLFTFLE